MIPNKLLQQEWFLLEKLFQYPPIGLEPPMNFMGRYLVDFEMTDVIYSINEYRKGRVNMYSLVEERGSAAKHALEKIIEKPDIIDAIHTRSDEQIVPQVKELAEKILDTDVSSLGNEELADIYTQLSNILGRLQLMRVPGWLMETGYELFSNYLVDYLKNFIEEKGLSLDPVMTFATLTSPIQGTLSVDEHRALFVLARDVQDGKVNLSVDDARIREHVAKYKFLTYGIEGPGLSEEKLVEDIQSLIAAGTDFSAELAKMDSKFEKIKQEQQELHETLNLDDKHKHLIQIAQDIVYQKAWSKEHQFFGWYALDKLMREIAKRLYLSIQQARYLLPLEIPQALRDGQVDAEELNSRYSYSLLCIDDQDSYFVTGDKAREMKAQMNIRDDEVEVDPSTKEFIGQVAVSGSARGKVKIVNTIEDMQKMQEGDILVSEMTIPEIVPAMKKAAAIVTDMGGITCHAAIVSRELGKPCVIGSRIATRLLQDGDEVEVDAVKGIIKIQS